MSTVLAAQEILPQHTKAHFLGLTFHVDTIFATAIAGAIVIGLGLYMRVRASRGVPSKLQLAWEAVVDYLDRQVTASVGSHAPYVVPLAVTLFVFILIANWMEILPAMGYVPAPTEDVNLPYAMAAFVIIWAYADGIRKRGAGDYVKEFFQPYWWLAPFNFITEIVKPVTLSLRLWGNMFGGALMIAILALLPPLILWLPQAGWRLFELFIGAIQAFIFALLTVLYFGQATSAEF